MTIENRQMEQKMDEVSTFMNWKKKLFVSSLAVALTFGSLAGVASIPLGGSDGKVYAIPAQALPDNADPLLERLDELYAELSDGDKDTIREVRDRIAWLLSDEHNKHFWPEEDEQMQLALIDFVRLLPGMWD